MNQVEKRFGLLEKAEAILARRPYSKQDEAEFKSTMLLADSLNDGARRERIAGVIGAEERNAEQEQEVQFRSYLRNPEHRTYSGLVAGTGSAGGYFVPTEAKKEYTARLVSSSGWLKAGVTVVEGPAIGARPYLSFFSDDQANVASSLSENQQLTRSNPVAAKATPAVKKFSSGTTVSRELVSDVAFPIDSYIQNLFGSRVGRAFNTYASNDSSNGIVPKLTVSATAASATVPTISELTDLQTSVDYGYRDGASYMVSPIMEAVLRKQIGTSGNKLYPEMEDGKLLGHNYVVNVDLPYAASSVGVVFGNFARAIIVQAVAPILISSAEMAAEFYQIQYNWFHRMGCALVDSNALVALQLHS